jgi:methyl acetate hydrolase
VLPEFAAVRVLDSIGAEGPVLRPPRTTCTVRHLLTHQSGFAYDLYDAKQAAYQ